MSVRPLSPAQERIWRAEQFQPGTPANVVSVAAALGRHHGVSEVRQELRAAVARRPWLHSSLRTVDGRLGMVPADPGDLRLPVLDLRHLPDAERDSGLAEIRAEQARTPFDLAREPALRVLLVLVAHETVLVVTAHRIATDESAVSVLMAELSTGDGQPAPAAEPAQQAGDVTERAAADSRSAVDFWRSRLAEPQPPTLPTDWPRPLVASARGAAVELALPTELAPDTDVLLAVFQSLLVRLGSSTDITLTLSTAHPTTTDGTPEQTVIRIDLADDPSLDTLRSRVRAARLEAARHRMPLAELADELAGQDPRPDPFSSVAMAVRDRPLLPEPLRPLPTGPLGVEYELRVVIEPDTGGKLTGRLEYATELFERVSAERIAARYAILLAAAVAEPTRPMSELALLTEAERRLVLHSWGGARTGFVPDKCLHHLIEEQCALAPEATAVICGERSLSYAQLDSRASQLAHRLAAAGVGPGHRVAVCTQRSVGTVVAILATLKAGAAYVPLDPAYPAGRLAFVLADSQASVVVTDAVARTRLPEQAPAVMVVEDQDAEPTAAPDAGVRPEDPCYLIYTSGSTGTPKGAVNSHRGVINTMTALISRIRLHSDSRLLQTSSLSFDMSAFDIFATLLAGGCLVVPEASDLASSENLIDLVHRHGVTVWSSAPPLFKAMLDEALGTMRRLPDGLRTVVVGGDRFPPAACAAMFEVLPGCRAFNVAGVTEVSFTTTAYQIQAGDAHRSSVPWGMPLPNQQMYVLDPGGELVPPGIPGELYLGGTGVGLGYWNQPELTAQRYLPDPFEAGPDARMYRTGDQVRHLPNGDLEFLGRLDHQVKVRGFRIELGEVENVIATHPLVRDAVAGIRPDEPTQDNRLVLYVSFRDPDKAATVEELRAFLGERLPDYLVPSTYVEIPAVPLLPSGKIDRAALDEVEVPTARPNLGVAYVPPRDSLEQLIVDEWALVLGMDRIGVDDEFVALGGHSMLATPTMSTLGRALGISLSARDLFEAPTPARLATRIRGIDPSRPW